MSKYISGRKFIEERNLRGFEFFQEYIKRGLQPYDHETGKPVEPPDIRIKRAMEAELQKKLFKQEHTLGLLGKSPEIDRSFNQLLKKKDKTQIEVERFERLGHAILFREGHHRGSIDRIEKDIKETKSEIELLKKELSTIKNASWNNFNLPDSQPRAKRVVDECLWYIYAWKEIEELEQKYGLGSSVMVEDKAAEQIQGTQGLANKSDLPQKVIDLIGKARPEVDLIYNTIKEGEGFSEQSKKAAERRQENALHYFQEYRKKFKVLKKRDLKNVDTYYVTNPQTARTIKGKLLQTVVSTANYGKHSYQRLYAESVQKKH